MKTNTKNYRIKSILGAIVTQASLLGMLACTSLPAIGDDFTVKHSRADLAFSQFGLTGAGVGVAILDSGIHQIDDLKDMATGQSRIVFTKDFVTGSTITEDKCGHGTHIAGLIGGSGFDSTGSNYFRTYYGIARKCSFINVRVLDDKGQGTVSQVISGIQWAIENKTRYNIRVMNLSLGHPVGEGYATDPLCQAVEAAWKAGIVVVCAAGNGGRLNETQDPSDTNEGWGTAYGTVQSPGNSPYVITVGSMKQTDGLRINDKIATYSGRGPSRLDYVMKPDIVAPGNKVVSTDADGSYLVTHFHNNRVSKSEYWYNITRKDPSDKYFRLSGTSMATPVVAGAAALMIQNNSALTPDMIKARLMISADKWLDDNENSDPCTYGAGFLNITAALASTATPTMSALSPSLVQDANGNVFVDPARVIWGTDINGNRVIWGTAGVEDIRVVWGNRVIWGESLNILDASRVIWGTSVWADRVVWGTSTSAVDLSSKAIFGE